MRQWRQFDVDARHRVSGLLVAPAGARIGYLLAHGAGAGMRHRSMEAVAAGLAERGIATFRYQFPYLEEGLKRPDPPALCHATVRAAASEAREFLPGLPLIAGGRSFGGRMTSQAHALSPLSGVRGLAFLAFPLHPAGRPGTERATHLFDIQVPMLFLSGTRDALAELSLLTSLCTKLGQRATLRPLEPANHSFHASAQSGRKDADILSEALDTLVAWANAVTAES
jgi:predicted alpha/beta-hydrolase family hydrolase